VPGDDGRLTADHLGGSKWLVELRGEHDLTSAGDLRGQLDAIFATGTCVVVDLSAATFIDSSILSELVRAQRRVERDPGEQLAVVAPTGGFVARLFDQVGFDALLSVFQTRADALGSFEGG
jgi:anti-sigma B factor antagonist